MKKDKKETAITYPPFNVNLEMTGDDFHFVMEINFEMAGKIIEYVGAEREKAARKLNP
jgi:hypothetical protein